MLSLHLNQFVSLLIQQQKISYLPKQHLKRWKWKSKSPADTLIDIHVAPVPLDWDLKKEIVKQNLICFKLHSTPVDDKLPLYEVSVGIFKTRTPKEVLAFLENANKVIVGQKVTTGPLSISMSSCTEYYEEMLW